MSPRRIAVLVGSHDQAFFTRYAHPDGPSEAAVLAEFRAQRSKSDASHSASVTRTQADHFGSTARRFDAGIGRVRVRVSGDPPRMSASAVEVRTRRPTRGTLRRISAHRTASP